MNHKFTRWMSVLAMIGLLFQQVSYLPGAVSDTYQSPTEEPVTQSEGLSQIVEAKSASERVPSETAGTPQGNLPNRVATDTASTICSGSETETVPYLIFLPLVLRGGSALVNVATPLSAEFGAPSQPPVIASANFARATEFLYTGSQPRQTGVVSGTIDPQQVAVLRGKVCNGNGQPLSDVHVTVLNHPEYGASTTQADGFFDLVVNGGVQITVVYTRTGYLTAQRQVQAPWQDYAWLSEVVLLPLDPQVTTIDLTANIPIQVAQGSVMSDTDGIRQARLFVPQGTQAYMTLPGGITQTLSTFHVRITEYTVGPNGPAAMPAELPPASGYTYAAEYSVDEAEAAGASEVRFNQPVISYLENFLNFAPGTIVPAGYYDRQTAVWVPSDNGRVVKIVSIISDTANLDTDGDGIIDNGNVVTPTMALTITVAERQSLSTLYQAGQTLWRVPITHFSAWDSNWPFKPEPPALAPNQSTTQSPPVDDSCKQPGSIIECQNQTLGEAVGIAGTPFSLHYHSGRVPDRATDRAIEIPLSVGITPPPSLKRIDLEISIAGRRFERSFAPTADQTYTFVWDGKDAYGRVVPGARTATVRIGYAYKAVYATPGEMIATFALFGDTLTMVSAREEVMISQEWSTTLYNYVDAKALGGWSLNVNHTYDRALNRLYLGNGEQRDIGQIGNVIQTVAGNGTMNFSGDGLTATQASLWSPYAVALGPDGSLYIADAGNNRIRKVDASGIITTVAGTNDHVYNNDGIPAITASLWTPYDIAVGADGSLYIADTNNRRVRKVDASGIITTVAGNGLYGSGGDGGPATLANVNLPTGIALSQDGSLYIADGNLRRVGPDGLIHTITNTLVTGVDFASAGLAVGPEGDIYFANSVYTGIERVWPDGKFTWVTDRGSGYSGDGGPAEQARIRTPYGIDVDSLGQIYVADYGNLRIRRIGTDNIINTFAGNGQPGTPADSAPVDGASAQQSRLSGPRGVAVAPDGHVYVADAATHRVYRIGPPSIPGLAANETPIPAEDGSEVYVFDENGRHLRTLNALTTAVRYQFGYDSAGRLVTVTDGDNNVTTITRDSNGHPTSIVAPFGQTTTFTLDANGYLKTITNPAQETVQFEYTAGGLMTKMTDARHNIHTFKHDTLGRLTRDDDPASGYSILTRVQNGQAYTIALTTAMSRTTYYRVDNLPTDAEQRVDISPDGLRSESIRKTDGTLFSRSPDGTTQGAVLGPDPRWGMLAPMGTLVTATLPSGLTYRAQTTSTASLSDKANPFSLLALTMTTTINSRSYTSTYTAATRTWVERSPEGRVVTTTTDLQGRVVYEQVAGLAPASYVYDGRGRLVTATLGTGEQARVATFSYNSASYLASVTDPLNRIVSFGYDAVGRVLTQTLPDGRQITYAYNANGNLSSLTPPGRPAHAFDYTPIDLASRYTPPDVNPGSDDTQYAYNPDRQLTLVTQPDGQTIGLGYDTVGRLDTLSIARGLFNIHYDPTTSNVNSIDAPGNSHLAYSYDGALLKSQTWSGAIASSIVYTYDVNLQMTATNVNGISPITFQYDKDSLLTQAGALTLSHNPQNGLLTGSTLGSISDTWTYNNLGEPVTYTASSLFNVGYERDQLGRIITRTEMISGVTDVFIYAYDLVGRLSEVTKNGVTLSVYTYDSNSNRLSYTNAGGTITGTYDAQDRLLHYGATTYGYTANGELLTKTIGAQTTNYQYDALGNLITVTLPNSMQIVYLTDGQNRHVGKKVNGVVTQGLLYESQLRPIAELDVAGNIVSRFVYATRVNVPDYMLKGGVTYRFILDHLGSPRLIVNAANGQIAQRMDYDEFGHVLLDTNPGFQPFGFAGGVYDPQTGLAHFDARDYDAEIGRWTERDLIGFRGGSANLFDYVLNEPINYVDPVGLWGIAVSGGISAGARVGGTYGSGVYLGTEGLYYYGGGGGGVHFGATAGVGATITVIWDWDAFNQHGTEWGVNTPVCGVALYQGNKDATSLGGPLAGLGVSIGKGWGAGDVHAYKTYTESVNVVDAIANWLEQAGREIRRIYGAL